MSARYIDVIVEAHDAIPDGCQVRFQAAAVVPPPNEPRDVQVVRYAPAFGPAGLFRVEARAGEDSPGPARAETVRIPGAGTSVLLVGGRRGLRLFPATGTPGARDERTLAEPYLLLPPAAIVS